MDHKVEKNTEEVTFPCEHVEPHKHTEWASLVKNWLKDAEVSLSIFIEASTNAKCGKHKKPEWKCDLCQNNVGLSRVKKEAEVERPVAEEGSRLPVPIEGILERLIDPWEA